MLTTWRRIAAKTQRIFRLIVLFCALRIAVGLGAILLFDRDAVALGYELTFVVLAVLAVYLLVALAVRRWAPPRRAAEPRGAEAPPLRSGSSDLR